MRSEALEDDFVVAEIKTVRLLELWRESPYDGHKHLAHLLSYTVVRKLFNIEDAGTTKLLTRFITEGKQDQLRGKVIKGGFTVWRMKSRTPTPLQVETIDEAIKEAMRP